jgi:integrase
VKRFAQHVAARGIAPNTVRLALAPVKALFATAVEEGLIRANPTAGLRLAQTVVEPGTGEEERVKALTEPELRCLLGEIPAAWRPFFEFLAHTGLRIGEAIAFRWADVDFGRRRVCGRRRYYRGSFAPPKSRYGRRDVPLSKGTARALAEAWEAQGRPQADELVFSSARGTVLDSST